jgi:oxygen-independent coproporphyrinogen-3 oxidase
VDCSLYVHIPFCVRKCRYCDFNSTDRPVVSPDEYTDLLVREFRAVAAGSPHAPVPTIYFGGGTPSLFPPAQIFRLITAVAELCGIAPAAEVTLEVNPGTVTRETLRGYRAAGVNRLSIGIQSFDDEKLRLLGRVHTVAEARDTFASARAAGFGNIGIDLMHSLPGQGIAEWRETLGEAVTLKPDHISAYGLTVEEGTPLAAMVEQGEVRLPDEETAAAMFELTADALEQAGYEHYEISNFARPGFRSQHNQVYWRRRDYLGIGAGAHSFFRSPGYGVRWENPAGLAEFAAHAGNTERYGRAVLLSRREAMAEFFFLGLRMTEGVDLRLFAGEFGAEAGDEFPGVIEKLTGIGLLTREGEMIRLSRTGLLLANRVMAEFV